MRVSNNLKNVASVQTVCCLDKRNRATFKLLDTNGNVCAYVKRTQTNERERLETFINIVTGDLVCPGGLGKKYNIEIEYPHIINFDFDSLPEHVKKYIENEILHYLATNTLRKSKERLQEYVFLSSVDVSGMTLSELQARLDFKLFDSELSDTGTLKQKLSETMMNYLNGVKMSLDEWYAVKGFVTTLYGVGFEHGDLYHNMFIKRNPDTQKIKLTFLDFEFENESGSDKYVLDLWEEALYTYDILNTK